VRTRLQRDRRGIQWGHVEINRGKTGNHQRGKGERKGEKRGSGKEGMSPPREKKPNLRKGTAGAF